MKVKIAGVPEHFNYPWQMAIANREFEDQGLDVSWISVPEGTGKMCAMLRDGSADMAVILTEGIVKDILGGNPSKIIQEYVSSPLIWGIHVWAESPYRDLSELEGKKAAISRLGSGSQLMAFVNARQQGWDLSEMRFEVVHTIEGAVSALGNGRADYFMWEHFMTKPLVDNGTFRRVADCPTPWPCFMISATDRMLDENPEAVKKILRIINRNTAKFKEIPGISKELSLAFDQRLEDIDAWLNLTEWSAKIPSDDMLNKVQIQLLELSLIDKKGTFAEIVRAI